MADPCELLYHVTCSRLNDAIWQYAALRHAELSIGGWVVLAFLVPVVVGLAVWGRRA